MMAYRDLADDKLLELLRSNDHGAYEEIYRRYWAILFRHARRMLSDDEEARDLVQDLFEVLWKKAADLVVDASLSAYLYGMVRYRVFDLFDKQKVQKRHLQSLDNFINQGEYTTDQTIRTNELSRIIECEIALLPPKMRKVFELSRKSHFSYGQISTAMDISDQTVKKQIHNALKILRLKLSSSCVLLVLTWFLNG